MNNISSIPGFKTSQEKRAFWFAHVDACEASSKSQIQYCNENGLKLSTFGYFRGLRTPKKKSAALPFIKMTPKPENSTISAAPQSIQLKLSNGIVAHIPLSIGTAEIIRLLQGLGGVDVKISA